MFAAMSHNDFELVQRTADGNPAAFRTLYDRYRDIVFNTSLSYLQNREDAEEVTQDIFIELYHSASKFEGRSAVSTWLYRIAVNRCIDKLRSKKSKAIRASFTSLFSGEREIDHPHFDHPGIILEKKEDARELFAAMDKLPERQLTAFILTYIEELPQKEIAAIMDLNLKAVESLLQRAKAGLRKNLARRRKKSLTTSNIIIL